MRLIDADDFYAVCKETAEQYRLTKGAVEETVGIVCQSLVNTPTVDAVEVVRCKDCKHSTPDIMSEDYMACWERNTVMPNDGFCSYGKRKEVSE